MKLFATALTKKEIQLNWRKFFYLLKFCFFEFDRKKFLNDRDIELCRWNGVVFGEINGSKKEILFYLY